MVPPAIPPTPHWPRTGIICHTVCATTAHGTNADAPCSMLSGSGIERCVKAPSVRNATAHGTAIGRHSLLKLLSNKLSTLSIGKVTVKTYCHISLRDGDAVIILVYFIKYIEHCKICQHCSNTCSNTSSGCSDTCAVLTPNLVF